jgi:hypothetical protein
MRGACFLLSILALAKCGAEGAPVSSPEHAPPTLGEAQPRIDPYDPDAAIGARVDALFSTCGGGPETSCHSSGTGGLHLLLGPGGDVVNVRSTERPDLFRVQPFEPRNSYLYLKVLGDGGIEGGRMPLDEVVPDQRIPELVGAWIEDGAPDP